MKIDFIPHSQWKSILFPTANENRFYSQAVIFPHLCEEYWSSQAAPSAAKKMFLLRLHQIPV